MCSKELIDERMRRAKITDVSYKYFDIKNEVKLVRLCIPIYMNFGHSNNNNYGNNDGHDDNNNNNNGLALVCAKLFQVVSNYII